MRRMLLGVVTRYEGASRRLEEPGEAPLSGQRADAYGLCFQACVVIVQRPVGAEKALVFLPPVLSQSPPAF